MSNSTEFGDEAFKEESAISLELAFPVFCATVAIASQIIVQFCLKNMNKMIKTILSFLSLHMAALSSIGASAVLLFWDDSDDKYNKCRTLNFLIVSNVLITIGNLAAISYVKYYMAFKTAMLETIKTPIIVGLVVLPYVCGYLLSTLLFASEMTIFVYGCMGISNSNNAGEKWPFWIYILYVLILLYLGVWYDIALYYLLKNWNQIQARVNPDRVVVPWNSSGDEEGHDYTLPVGSSTLTVMIAFFMLLLFGITIHIM